MLSVTNQANVSGEPSKFPLARLLTRMNMVGALGAVLGSAILVGAAIVVPQALPHFVPVLETLPKSLLHAGQAVLAVSGLYKAYESAGVTRKKFMNKFGG